MKNPQEVWEPAFIEALVQGNSAWRIEQLGRGSHAGTGMILREVNTNGDLTDRIVQWHPGGGYHGSQPYWKVSSGKIGTVRIGPQFSQP